MSRIAVVGTGYVGLTTGACLAKLGHDVVCADIDEDKVEELSKGQIPIVEAGLEQLVQDGLKSGNLRFVVGAARGGRGRRVRLPLRADAPSAPTVRPTSRTSRPPPGEIAPVLDEGAIVVNKSTVPVGSTKVVERVLGRPDVSVVSNPEFLREGSAVHDFMHPDRIVVGADDRAAAARVASLYLGVAAPFIVTDPASAETIKYAANAFLATKISFVNAIAAVCEAVGADVADVVLGIGSDKRIGHDFLKPGPGWGARASRRTAGPWCGSRRTAATTSTSSGASSRSTTSSGRGSSTRSAGRAAARSRASTVAVWGLTFKARTDDLRDSPALAIVDELRRAGALRQGLRPDRQGASCRAWRSASTPTRPARAPTSLVVLTEWDDFRWLDPDRVADLMPARRSWTPATCSSAPPGSAPASPTRASGAERLEAPPAVIGPGAPR